MRKSVLLVLMAIMSFCCVKAQDEASIPPKVENEVFGNPFKRKPGVIADKISADGIRFLWGNFRSAKHTLKDKWSFNVGIVAIEKGDNRIIQLYMKRIYPDIKPSVLDSSPFLMKFGNDAIYQGLVKGDAYTQYNCVTLLGRVVDTYESTFYVDIDEYILEGLKKGLAKIRYEVNRDIADVIMKEDNLSQFLLDEYNIILETLARKRDFKEGF